jgi:hypothetical protein
MKVVVIPKTYQGERLDRFVMTHFKLPWSVAHKLIRSKKAFVVKKHETEAEKKFVYRDAAYKIDKDDELCYPKDLKQDIE